jgi:hypothetical protein
MIWINKYWSTFGGIMAIGIIIIVLLTNNGVVDIQSLLWIHLAILLLHQFEEYSFPGKFKDFYNANILNKNRITKFPLNDNGILMVNLVLGWTFYLIAAIFGEKTIWLTIGLLGVTTFNGLMHTIMFFKLKKYNPGFITGLFIFIPFGLYLFPSLKGFVEVKDWILGVIIFVIGTALIPISIRLTNNYN